MSENYSIRIVRVASDPASEQKLTRLSCELDIPLIEPSDSQDGLALMFSDNHLELRQAGSKMKGVWCDFQNGGFGHRLHGLNPSRELLLRAIGVKTPGLTVIDATAGLGRDSALMALAGCRVTALERSPIIAALLRDGIDRAGAPLADLKLVRTDALEFLAAIPAADRPQVIYLDPMFPHRTKSALVCKEMRLTRLITGDDAEANQLLELARTKALGRIVVKRPLRAPTLSSAKPAFDYRGKAVRFDVYLPR